MPESHPHETRDVSTRPVLLSAAALVVLIVVAAVALEVIFGPVPPPAPFVLEDASAPPLQRDPADDLARFRDSQQAEAERLVWIDRDRGIARIPVADAVRLYPGLSPRAGGCAVELPDVPRFGPCRGEDR
jgi:hypothetical protein